MIRIHQIQLTDANIDTINEFGHDSVPAHKFSLDLQFGKKELTRDAFDVYYVPAYDVDTDSLEEAFRITNLWDAHDMEKVEVLGDRNHSTSVGDVAEIDGKFFVCAPVGWTRAF